MPIRRAAATPAQEKVPPAAEEKGEDGGRPLPELQTPKLTVIFPLITTSCGFVLTPRILYMNEDSFF